MKIEKIQFWMFNIIELAIQERKKKFTPNHRDCNWNCNNKLCDIGQCNLILKWTDKTKEEITKRVMCDMGVTNSPTESKDKK